MWEATTHDCLLAAGKQWTCWLHSPHQTSSQLVVVLQTHWGGRALSLAEAIFRLHAWWWNTIRSMLEYASLFSWSAALAFSRWHFVITELLVKAHGCFSGLHLRFSKCPNFILGSERMGSVFSLNMLMFEWMKLHLHTSGVLRMSQCVAVQKSHITANFRGRVTVACPIFWLWVNM